MSSNNRNNYANSSPTVNVINVLDPNSRIPLNIQRSPQPVPEGTGSYYERNRITGTDFHLQIQESSNAPSPSGPPIVRSGSDPSLVSTSGSQLWRHKRYSFGAESAENQNVEGQPAYYERPLGREGFVQPSTAMASNMGVGTFQQQYKSVSTQPLTAARSQATDRNYGRNQIAETGSSVEMQASSYTATGQRIVRSAPSTVTPGEPHPWRNRPYSAGAESADNPNVEGQPTHYNKPHGPLGGERFVQPLTTMTSNTGVGTSQHQYQRNAMMYPFSDAYGHQTETTRGEKAPRTNVEMEPRAPRISYNETIKNMEEPPTKIPRFPSLGVERPAARQEDQGGTILTSREIRAVLDGESLQANPSLFGTLFNNQQQSQPCQIGSYIQQRPNADRREEISPTDSNYPYKNHTSKIPTIENYSYKYQISKVPLMGNQLSSSYDAVENVKWPSAKFERVMSALKDFAKASAGVDSAKEEAHLAKVKLDHVEMIAKKAMEELLKEFNAESD